MKCKCFCIKKSCFHTTIFKKVNYKKNHFVCKYISAYVYTRERDYTNFN